MNKPNPFISNLPDDMHCLQAVYIMSIQMLTGQKITMSQAEEETGFVSGRGTWPFQALLSLSKRSLYPIVDEVFDPKLFIRDPEAALLKQNKSVPITNEMINTSDIKKEVYRVALCLEDSKIRFTNSRPNLQNFVDAIDLGAVIFCHVNSKSLKDEDGYNGHVVIILEYKDDIVFVSDPGLPAEEMKRYSANDFKRGWEYPVSEMANIIAVFPTERDVRAYASTRI